MKIHPSLMFSGGCGDAFRRYASLFGGEIVYMVTYAESPLALEVPPDCYGVVRDPFGIRWEINCDGQPAA